MNDRPNFEFIPESAKTPTGASGASGAPWKVLSVDDDAGYQATLRYALRDLHILQRPIVLLTVDSAAEAARVLSEQSDIALILLDVVMETDDAGLRLVGAIREQIGNGTVRIVLLTGQPGQAPQSEVMRRFDIDDYWCKSDLGRDQLIGIVTSNLRTWERIGRLEQARRGLLMVTEASRAISHKRNLDDYTRVVLEHLARILGVDAEGISCARHRREASLESSTIVAATGRYRALEGRSLAEAAGELPMALLQRAVEARAPVEAEGCTVLYCSSEAANGFEYLTLVKVGRRLAPEEINLLGVFAENVSTGFTNVALFNRLSELAYRDPVLDCPNRNRLLLELANLSEPEARSNKLLVLMIDHFRSIVVTLGEAFLNQLMASLLQVLRQEVPDGFIARFHRGGFALLLPERGRMDQAYFEALFSQPLRIGNGHHIVFATVGVVPLRETRGLKPEQVLSLAESTVNDARSLGSYYQVLDPGLERRIAESYALLTDLRQALNEERLSLALQPKVRLGDGRVAGFEALVRWQHPVRGAVPPDRFIPLAETSGLIDLLGQQVLRASCEAARALQAAGVGVPVSFNVSGIELVRPGYFDQLLATVREAGADPAWLDLEITETRAMQEYQAIRPNLQRLIDAGMGVSIDDFGTGYSSLGYITRLAATTLKIDRAFVARLDHSRDEELVVEMILRLGRRFGFQVVAEGVETETQRQLLQRKGCVIGQGYLFARPLPLAEAIAWAQAHPPAGA